MENAPPPTTFTVPSRWDIWTSTVSSGFFWPFPFVFKLGGPERTWPPGWVLIQSGGAVRPPLGSRELTRPRP